MSDLHLKNVLSIDPKTNVEETWRQKEVIMKGGIQKSRYVIAADSYSATNMQWNSITPPSLKTVVERALRVRYTLQVSVVYPDATAVADRLIFPAVAAVTVGPTPANCLTLTAGQFVQDLNAGALIRGCLRNFPLQSCAVSVEVKINGTSTSVNSSEFVNNISLLFSDKEINKNVEFPAQPDSNATYEYKINQPRSPFALHDANPALNSRASYIASLISSTSAGGNVTDVYNFDITEQLIVSPFTYGDGIDSAAGLSNIDNLSVNINLDNVNRCISAILVPYNVGTTEVNFGAVRPALLIEFITPDPVLAERMPPQLVYSYENIKVENKTIGTGPYTRASADLSGISSQTLRASSIPDKLYITIKPSKSLLANSAALSVNTTNAYMNIKKLTLQWGNSGLKFSTYTEFDLYKMSVANGLKASWYDWKYGGKCLLIIDSTKDICLEPDQVAGQSNSFMTFQVTVDVGFAPLRITNQAVGMNFDLSVMTITNGKCVVSQKDCQFILTAPNGEEVLATTSDPKAKVDANSLPVDKANSGSLFGSAAKLLSRGLNLATKVNPQHIEMAKSALEQLHGGSVVGAGLHKKGHRRVY